MSRKWTEGPIKVAFKAERLRGGMFAVHPTPDGSGYWTVTHLPSGYAAARFLESGEAAKWCAEELAKLPVDWAAYRPTKTAAKALPKAVHAEVRRIMQEAMDRE